MSALHDRQMEHLSDLLGKGQLSNAEEIAALLKIELGERTEALPENENVQSFFYILGQIANQH